MTLFAAAQRKEIGYPAKEEKRRRNIKEKRERRNFRVEQRGRSILVVVLRVHFNEIVKRGKKRHA